MVWWGGGGGEEGREGGGVGRLTTPYGLCVVLCCALWWGV